MVDDYWKSYAALATAGIEAARKIREEEGG